MQAVAPNLSTLVGDIVGSKLISHAGSLSSLSKYPASTIQILGAEKALFRALKTKGKTPKYGLIFNSTFIGRAQQKNKGRISRYLANKCAIASRVDCYSEHPTNKFGEVLKDQMEERLKFLSSGTKPRKNKEVMGDVINELKKEGLYYGDTKVLRDGEVAADDDTKDKKDKKSKKDKKDSKKRKHSEIAEDSDESEEKPKKKKKKSKD
jgi:nucleolar protein 56